MGKSVYCDSYFNYIGWQQHHVSNDVPMKTDRRRRMYLRKQLQFLIEFGSQPFTIFGS